MLSVLNFLGGNLPGAASDVDSSLQGAVDVLESVSGTILTLIYIVLGIFLVVKGALIGMQIVKAADEPQVRQEKISSLKWLVIGVVIAYAVTFAADIVIDYVTKTVNK